MEVTFIKPQVNCYILYV